MLIEKETLTDQEIALLTTEDGSEFEDIPEIEKVWKASTMGVFDCVVGKYLGSSVSGKYNNTAYHFMTTTGKLKLFGTTDLNKKMIHANVGDYLIVCLESASKSPDGKVFYRWSVQRRKP